MIHSRYRYGASLTRSSVGVINQSTRSPIRATATIDRHIKQFVKLIITVTHVGEVWIIVDIVFGIGIATEFIDRFRDPQSLCINIIADSAKLVVFVMHPENMILDPGDATDDLHQKNHCRRDRHSDQRLHLPAHCSPPCGTFCKYQWRQTHRSWSPNSSYQRF